MNRYTAVQLPPQEPSTAYVCGRCSAIVISTDVHDASHPAPTHLPPASQGIPIVAPDGTTVGHV